MTHRRTEEDAATPPLLDRRGFLAAGSVSALGLGALPSIGHRLPIIAGPHDAQTTVAPPVTIQRLSWAGVKIQGTTRTILIDPWVTPSVWAGTWTAPIIPIEIATTTVSVLITHLHGDHFDPIAIQAAIGEQGVVFCHADVAASIASRGLRVTPLQYFEPWPAGEFMVTPVPAVDGVNDRQVSWIVTTRTGERYIHCGDTVWHGGFNRIGRTYGPFEAAFLPINGAKVLVVEPRPDVAMSMTPDAAAGAAAMLRAKLTVPIHYGYHDPATYLEHPDAVNAFRIAARRLGLAFEIVAPGEWVSWRAAD